MLTILKNKITTELLEFEMPDGFIIKIDPITKDIGTQGRQRHRSLSFARPREVLKGEGFAFSLLAFNPDKEYGIMFIIS